MQAFSPTANQPLKKHNKDIIFSIKELLLQMLA